MVGFTNNNPLLELYNVLRSHIGFQENSTIRKTSDDMIFKLILENNGCGFTDDSIYRFKMLQYTNNYGIYFVYGAKANDVNEFYDYIEFYGMRYLVVFMDYFKDFGKEYAHTIGTAYGYIVNKYKLIDKLINTLKNNPKDRRMVISLWQDAYLNTAVLPSCVWSSEWDVTDGKLNIWVHQRSCDVPLGLPFNVTQYAVLLSLIAQVTGLDVGTMDWSIKDAHIYINQIEGIKEQIKRYEELGDLSGAELWINKEVDDFYKFDNSRELKDIKVKKYKHHGPIKFPIAQ